MSDKGVEIVLAVTIGIVQEKRVFANHFAFLDLAMTMGSKWVELKYEANIDPNGELLGIMGNHLGSLASLHDIAVSVHAAFDEGINLGAVDKELLSLTHKRLRDSIDFAAIVGARYVTVHGGYQQLGYKLTSQPNVPPFQLVREELGGKAVSAMKNRVINEFGNLMHYAKGKGVTLALENLHGFSLERTRFPITPQDYHECRKALGPGLKLVYDSGHANSTGLSAAEFVAEIGIDNIIGAHIHDNDGTDDQHLALGEGNIDFTDLAEYYKQNNGDFPLNLEMRFKKHFIEGQEYLRGLF